MGGESATALGIQLHWAGIRWGRFGPDFGRGIVNYCARLICYRQPTEYRVLFRVCEFSSGTIQVILVWPNT